MKGNTMTDNKNQQELATLLVQYQKGIAHDKVSQELRDAVAAVQDQGKAATVTLQVKIEPFKGNPDVLSTTITSNAKIPKPAPKPAIYYPDENGGLHRNDPKQRELWEDAADTADGKSAAAGRD
jgi:hypothetical protein